MTRAEQARHHIEDPGAFERKDASVRGLYVFLALLFGGIVVTLLIVAGLFGVFSRAREKGPVPQGAAAEAMLPPEPRLERLPGRQLERLRAEEDRELHSYGWVDRKAGVVRIPIERAMQLLEQHGLPVRQGAQPSAAPATGAPSGGPQTGAPKERKANGTTR
jgi:hypothetical protein